MDQMAFSHHLRAVLLSLYDPSILRNSPLIGAFGIERQAKPGSALQRILIDAIESLRPETSTPAGMRSWRIYQLLRRRYTEQASQRELAADLNLSIRQLQREEKVARELLADYLWATYTLASTPNTALQPPVGPALADLQAPSRSQELAEFRDSVPAQMTDIEAVLREVLKTIEPLLRLSGTVIHYHARQSLPRAWLQMPMLRQAVLNLVGMAARFAPGQEIRLWTETAPNQVCILLSAAAHRDALQLRSAEYLRDLEITERLVSLCRGRVELGSGMGGDALFTAKVTLPTVEESLVLVIDDNADTRLLFQRYLTGSRYRFVGAADAQQGLALALDLNPRVIVLDAMMSGTDGWTLLGQLREHPRTGHIPVVVCTILAHKELALALGAVEFLRKPVNRATLLATLDRQLDRPVRESC
jgi:CheY-like chemotaxis protein